MHTIDIKKGLLLSVKAARQKYQIYLDDQNNEAKQSEIESQNVTISVDMDKLQLKCNEKQKAIEFPDKEFVDCIQKGELKRYVSSNKGQWAKAKKRKKGEND